MQFSYLLSAFLATLAVASPIVNSGAEADIDIVARDETFEAATLEARAKGDTKPYELLSSVHKDLKDGKWYVFALKDPLGAKFDGSDKESKTDLEKLQKKLGFEHIRYITGKVKEEKKSGKVIKRDVVNLKFHDLSKENKNADSPIKLRHIDWQIRDAKAKDMDFVKETTEAKVNGLAGFGKLIHSREEGRTQDHATYTGNPD